MKTINIGLCGLGTVGAGVLAVLRRNQDVIASRCDARLVVSHIGSRSDKPDVDTSGIQVSQDIFAVARDPEVNILVELIGGTTTALDLVKEAIASGKSVVTANKALLAEHGNELFAFAREQNVSIFYEAAVAGGIPIIKALREGLAANQLNWLAGIINGTGNFILTEMSEKKRSFSDVLSEAQDLGYAEADPTFDVEGIDAAHKLAILASIAFGMPLEPDLVGTEGISSIETVDLDYARELGYRIKHLGIARQAGNTVELRVHPTLIPEQQAIARVDGVLNAVMVNGDAVGPTLFTGAGAGAEPTASAVIADLVDLARLGNAACNFPMQGVIPEDIKQRSVLPLEDIETESYLRICVEDRPGVMSDITQLLGDAGVSIEALLQKEHEAGESETTIIMLTSRVREAVMLSAIEEIQKLDSVRGGVIRLRVEPLDNG
jgi:homoserine dehydrogenase